MRGGRRIACQEHQRYPEWRRTGRLSNKRLNGADRDGGCKTRTGTKLRRHGRPDGLPIRQWRARYTGATQHADIKPSGTAQRAEASELSRATKPSNGTVEKLGVSR